jgi:hypothetical protein
VRTSWANHKSMGQRFWVLRVKRQKASLNRWPIAYTAGEGSVLTQHQSRDMEPDGQRNTCHGSSGQAGRLLEISCFTRECSTPHLTTIVLGLGKTTISQDWYLAIQVWTKRSAIMYLLREINVGSTISRGRQMSSFIFWTDTLSRLDKKPK